MESTQEEDNATSHSRSGSPEPRRPALPPRPSNVSLMRNRAASHQGARPSLTADATTAVSMTDVNTYTRADGSKELRTTPARITSSSSVYNFGGGSSRSSDIGEDTSSVRSYLPHVRPSLDEESLFGDADRAEGDGTSESDASDNASLLERTDDVDGEVDFDVEFADIDSSAVGEDVANAQWKAKKKHFLILSAAGKPIYTRHGSDGIISSYVGILQTIISAYESWEDQLKSFTTGAVKFAILAQTNLFLVAVTHLPESDAQLRLQLEALYMQILSTLTLPALTHMFSVRPSTDLRRPLQGTEVLLSSLADSFTQGSASTLLSALECLRMRKSHRKVINDTFVKARVDDLLYGLIVAGGRLVSVIRPKKHSLHPSDLHLIFNMLFEAEGVKAGGGDSWIPICLPGFNNTGYLYMYVSFLDMGGDAVREVGQDEKIAKEDAVAIILLSANKESFEDMQSVKQYMIRELTRNKSLQVIQSAVQSGRPSISQIILPKNHPTVPILRHFLYKSKGNVQFFMPSFTPHYTTRDKRRALMSVYHTLHASVHAKHASVKVQHCVGVKSSSLAWVTPMFELYCVAGPGTSRNHLVQAANRIIQWIQKEEERIFLIGGAIF